MKSPTLESLIHEEEDRRKGRSDTALIIPTIDIRKLEAVEDHISDQEGEFDIIAVYGNKEDFLNTSMLHVRTKENLGPAGAFFVGQKVAMREGYEKIILADDDCIPKSKSLINSIRKELEQNHVVLPKESDNGRLERIEVLHHFGGFRSEVFLEVGFTFLPLFMGGVDQEFLMRVRRKFDIARINEEVSHPQKRPFFICSANDRQRYYCKNDIMVRMLNGKMIRTWISMAYHLLAGMIFFPVRRGVLNHCLEEAWLASSVDFRNCRNHFEAFGKGKIDGIIVDEGYPFWKTIGKDIIIDGDMTRAIVTLLLARSVAVRNSGKDFIIFRARSISSRIFWGTAFIVAIPFALIIALILTIRGTVLGSIRKIDTFRYGVEA